jgi:hypothetical protein
LSGPLEHLPQVELCFSEGAADHDDVIQVLKT